MTPSTHFIRPAANGHITSRIVALLGLLLLLGASQAHAQLMLYPTRVVFEGNQRAAQVQLVNNGRERATYRISLVNRRMNEIGGLVEIDQPLPDERFADSMLRYSPRQISLAAGETQTVRIMLRKPANLAAGEYRSHLLFAQQPEAEGRNSIETRNETNGIGVVLNMMVGASIPVIIRQGNTSAQVALSRLALEYPEKGGILLAAQLERNGNRSVYGDLTATFIPHGGTGQVVARANGVAVYTPNPRRQIKLQLQPPVGVKLAGGQMRLTFREQAKEGGEPLAEAVLQLP